MNRIQLTALLTLATLARRDFITGDTEDPPKLSEAEWEARKREELGKKSIDTLVSRQIDLERDLKKARDKAAPDGSRVLTADESAAYDAYVALGIPKELKTRLETGDKAVTDLAGRERGDTLRTVGEAMGWKPSVLTRLAGDLQFEVGAEVEKDGKKHTPVTVKTADGKSLDAGEYAKANWADFEASLQAGEQKQQEKRPLVTGGAGNTQGGSTGTALDAKRADTRYSI